MVKMHELVKSLSASYKSIDSRKANLKVGDDWVSVLSIVRLSRLSHEDLVRKHRTLLDRHGLIETPSFRIELDAKEFSEANWEALKQSLVEGQPNEWARQPVDLNSADFLQAVKKAEEESQYLLKRQIDELDLYPSVGPALYGENDWPSLVAYARVGKVMTEGSLSSLACLSSVNRELMMKDSSFTDVYDLLASVLDTGILGTGYQSGAYVKVPIYSNISHWDLAESSVLVRVLLDTNLLPFHLAISQRDSQGRPKFSRRIEITPGEVSDFSNGLAVWEKTIPLVEGLGGDDRLQVSLIHPSIPLEVGRSEKEVRWLLSYKKVLRHPLVRVASAFISWDELETHLTSRNAEQHELAVARLLTLMGLQSLPLGKLGFERLNGDPQMTADVLALHTQSNSLLLVGCTTGDPEDSDFNTLKRAQSHIESPSVKGAQVIVKPVIFCARTAPASKERRLGVKVLDAEDIHKIVSLLRQEAPEKALEECLGIVGN